MGSRWLNSVVVLFWMSTMTWLVVAKVVPPLRRGNPPNYRNMYAQSEQGAEESVGWDMTLNDKPLGWAINRVAKMGTDVTEVRGRIHFDRIPLQEFSPTWTRFILKTVSEPVDELQMDAFSMLEIDPLGQLTRFRSTLRVSGMRDAVVITGKAHASRLTINVESGTFQMPPFEAYLPKDALVSDELSPQTRITGLRLDQEWTVPVFSPLRPPKNPVEILHAKVESREPIEWEGKLHRVHQVVYRADSGSVFSASREPRAKLWVREDGMVLKQEINLLGSRIVFTRMNDEKSQEIAEQAEEDDERHRYLRKKYWLERRRESAEEGGPSSWHEYWQRRKEQMQHSDRELQDDWPGRGHRWWPRRGGGWFPGAEGDVNPEETQDDQVPAAAEPDQEAVLDDTADDAPIGDASAGDAPVDLPHDES